MCHGKRVEFAPCLFIDLDGTLIKTDPLVEGMIVWLLAGKARFKAEIVRRVPLDIATLLLPMQLQLVEYLKGEASRTRRLRQRCRR